MKPLANTLSTAVIREIAQVRLILRLGMCQLRVAFAGEAKELASLRDMWRSSPVLIEVRRQAVEIAQETLKQVKDGDQCQFCMGVAELQLGDPKAIYPQIARNAEFRARAYAAWKERNAASGQEPSGAITKCAM